MIDGDRLIKAWKIFRDSNPYEICNGREFMAIKEPEYCMGQMIEDTIALLKEQEAILVDTKVVGTSHGDMEVYCCRDCRNILDPAFHYCPNCGKAVTWE